MDKKGKTTDNDTFMLLFGISEPEIGIFSSYPYFIKGILINVVTGGLAMKLHRFYLISDDLDELELFEAQLEFSGITTPQINLPSLHDTEITHHDHINYVSRL